jgi:ketosteroid isomerase-like protein
MTLEQALSLSRPRAVVQSLHRAANARDLDGIVAHFAPDYVLDNPCRPDRSFRGADQVQRNWSTILGEWPDFVLEEKALAEDGDTVWAELVMRGSPAAGPELQLRGVMIYRVQGGAITAGTFYLAPVVHDGLDADAAVRTTVLPVNS